MSALVEDEVGIDHLEQAHAEDNVVCTSRSPHPCTYEATHRAYSTAPCPDPVKGVFWCASRYAMHRRLARHPYNCMFCQRDITVCWIVLPV